MSEPSLSRADSSEILERIRFANAILPGVPAPEGDEDPRWQAIIAVGEFVESNPEEVWQFVAHWGCHPDEDLRAAVSTCLLEHLLECHFDLIFPRVRRLSRTSAHFADTFSSCWRLGQSELPENSRKFEELQAKCRPHGGE